MDRENYGKKFILKETMKSARGVLISSNETYNVGIIVCDLPNGDFVCKKPATFGNSFALLTKAEYEGENCYHSYEDFEAYINKKIASNNAIVEKQKYLPPEKLIRAYREIVDRLTLLEEYIKFYDTYAVYKEGCEWERVKWVGIRCKGHMNWIYYNETELERIFKEHRELVKAKRRKERRLFGYNAGKYGKIHEYKGESIDVYSLTMSDYDCSATAINKTYVNMLARIKNEWDSIQENVEN